MTSNHPLANYSEGEALIGRGRDDPQGILEQGD